MILFLLLTLLSVDVQAKEKAIVVVFDTGLDIKDPRFKSVLCNTGHYDSTGSGLKDNNGHGTHVAGLIKKYAKNANYCMIIVKWTNGGKADHIKALNYLYTLNPSIVNMSLTGESFYEEEYSLIRYLKNTTFIVSAGNEGANLSVVKKYPVNYIKTEKNVIGVASTDRNGIRSITSNYGLPNLKWEIGENVVSTLPRGRMGYITGTSMSTAIFTGKYVQKNFK